ncbi:MAG TPA: LptA/OstA family protein [Myxococcaceae bacterium]|nr:LptA/OstA family protein [Myxococcaceae bacterium]
MAALLLTAGSPSPPDGGTSVPSLAARVEKVTIHADRLQILNKQMLMVWTGRVRAKRGTTDLQCDRAVASYSDAQTREVTRIECTGNVVVTDGDRWAKGERADFDNLASILVVTGSPQARQAGNTMRGSKVVFNMANDTVEVENARAVFEPTPESTKTLRTGKSK